MTLHRRAKSMQSIIDTNFDFHSDASGDPDTTSPTLRKYHKILWSKPLPNCKNFELYDNKKGIYLYHNSELGEFFLGSDAITHSYRNQIRKRWITRQIPNEVDELYKTGSTIGAYIVFPNKKIDGNLRCGATVITDNHYMSMNKEWWRRRRQLYLKPTDVTVKDDKVNAAFDEKSIDQCSGDEQDQPADDLADY